MAFSCSVSVYANGDNSENRTGNSEAIENEKGYRPTYKELYNKIYLGKASLLQVKQALSVNNTRQLTNVIHALYAMRWHQGVVNLLQSIWSEDKKKEPKLKWKMLESTEVRIAVASTLNRIEPLKSIKLREYIRSYKYDDSDKNVGQVLVALGLNGDPKDVPYLEEMADSDNRYLTQIGISSLAFMSNATAKESLINLAKKYYNTPRGDLINGVLERVYNMVPVERDKLN